MTCRVYSAVMSASTAREVTVVVTCLPYISLTASFSAFGSCTCWMHSCSSVRNPETFASASLSLERCVNLEKLNLNLGCMEAGTL